MTTNAKIRTNGTIVYDNVELVDHGDGTWSFETPAFDRDGEILRVLADSSEIEVEIQGAVRRARVGMPIQELGRAGSWVRVQFID